jgi:hypothetical protein
LHDVILVAAMSDGHWRPGIGDPTPIGWFTVAAYFAAAIVCGRVWQLDRRAHQAGANASPTFWLTLTVLLGALGVNKQLDLQSLLTDVARSLAKSQNWYAQRREVQLLFIAAVGVAAVVALAAFAWIARKEWKRSVTALAGIVLLLSFIVIRAASFHHVDAFINTRLAGVKWNAILELGGIGLVALGSVLAMRADHGRTAARPDDPGRDDAMGPRRYWIPGAGPAASPSRDRNRRV